MQRKGHRQMNHIEFYYAAGKLPRKYYYMLNVKTPIENYIDYKNSLHQQFKNSLHQQHATLNQEEKKLIETLVEQTIKEIIKELNK